MASGRLIAMDSTSLRRLVASSSLSVSSARSNLGQADTISTSHFI